MSVLRIRYVLAPLVKRTYNDQVLDWQRPRGQRLGLQQTSWWVWNGFFLGIAKKLFDGDDEDGRKAGEKLKTPSFIIDELWSFPYFLPSSRKQPLSRSLAHTVIWLPHKKQIVTWEQNKAWSYQHTILVAYWSRWHFLFEWLGIRQWGTIHLDWGCNTKRSFNNNQFHQGSLGWWIPYQSFFRTAIPDRFWRWFGQVLISDFSGKLDVLRNLQGMVVDCK